MVQVVFMTKKGAKTASAKPGERLIDVAWRLNLDEEGMGKCGGHCLCATCHVWVKEGLDLFEKADVLEENMLDTVDDLQKNSRLGCQLKITKAHTKIVVEVPAQ